MDEPNPAVDAPHQHGSDRVVAHRFATRGHRDSSADWRDLMGESHREPVPIHALCSRNERCRDRHRNSLPGHRRLRMHRRRERRRRRQRARPLFYPRLLGKHFNNRGPRQRRSRRRRRSRNRPQRVGRLLKGCARSGEADSLREPYQSERNRARTSR